MVLVVPVRQNSSFGFGRSRGLYPLRITLATGAKFKVIVFDGRLSQAHAIQRRYPYQADPTLRKAINNGEVMYIDQHLSEMADNIRHHNLPSINVGVIAADCNYGRWTNYSNGFLW